MVAQGAEANRRARARATRVGGPGSMPRPAGRTVAPGGRARRSQIGYHACAMTRDRLALFLTSSALLVSWLSMPAWPTPDTGSESPSPRQVRPPPADPASELAFDVVRETERLRLRVAAAPGPRRGGRDPFTFGVARRPASRPPLLSRTAEPREAAAAPGSAAPARPALRLIGLAERHATEGMVRSAILSGDSDVYIVTEGDLVQGRFTVVGVGADAVDLLDAVTQEALRLPLPQ